MTIHRSTLSILGGNGDMKLTWDPANTDECEQTRKTVADLKAKGYGFFLVDNRIADEVEAGQGTLIVKKLTAEEVVPEPVIEEAVAAPKRRGRPPKAVPAAQNVVAIRPVMGG